MSFAASIIIPTLNEEEYLPVLLASLKDVKSPLDIIVVDGNSEDKTREVVERFLAEFVGESSLQFVQASARGISMQRNMGATLAKHGVLIFCDADIAFTSAESYQKLVSEFVERKYVVSAPVMVPMEPGLNFKIMFRFAYYMQRLLLLFRQPYFAGSCLLTTKETFIKVGGFDTTVLLGEDVDYSLKASKVGLCGLTEVPIKVSARRIIKYGYWWLLKELPNLLQFPFTGKIKEPERLFYPFGEFGDVVKKK